MEATAETRNRLIAKIDVTESCWVWTGAMTQQGYGSFRLNGRSVSSHRASYMLLVGDIPDGLWIDHLCRNRACVNPGHLEPVTPGENTRRGIGPTAVNAAKTHCIHGHPLEGDNLYRTRNGGRLCKACRAACERRRKLKRTQAEGNYVGSDSGRNRIDAINGSDRSDAGQRDDLHALGGR